MRPPADSDGLPGVKTYKLPPNQPPPRNMQPHHAATSTVSRDGKDGGCLLVN